MSGVWTWHLESSLGLPTWSLKSPDLRVWIKILQFRLKVRTGSLDLDSGLGICEPDLESRVGVCSSDLKSPDLVCELDSKAWTWESGLRGLEFTF